jgi:hypothetical protein
MREFSINIEHSSDATFDPHWSRIVYLISYNLFIEMGITFYKIFIIIHLNNDSVNVGVPSEHVKVIRSKIGPEFVEKCRDVQNEPVWANFSVSDLLFFFYLCLFTTNRDARPLSFYNLSLPCNLNMNPSQLTSVTAETSKATSTRQQNWLPIEDRQLCRSWISISIDVVVGVNQKGNGLWKKSMQNSMITGLRILNEAFHHWNLAGESFRERFQSFAAA